MRVGGKYAGENNQKCKAGGFGSNREEGGNRSGRTLIDIGHPDLKGHRANLESDAGEHEHDADGSEEVVGVVIEENTQGIEIHRIDRGGVGGRVACHTVKQNDAEEQQGGTKRAKDEVFEAGLQRERIGAGVADEDIETDRDSLEGDEEQDEVVRLAEQHEGGSDDEHDAEKLGLGHLLLFQRNDAEDGDKDGAE